MTWAQDMLVELEIELGRFAQAAERVAALRGASEAALPLELDIKEGVCHAYLGELKRAEALWKPLRLHPQRLNLYADLLYEVGLTYHTLDRLREAHDSLSFEMSEADVALLSGLAWLVESETHRPPASVVDVFGVQQRLAGGGGERVEL